MSSRVALITGANKGIGFETARQLARLDVEVLLGARTAAKAQAAAAELARENVAVEPLELDVTDSGSIARAAASVRQLDILINNAGIMVDPNTPPSRTSREQLRETFETNFFGLVETTQAFLPALRESAAGRIVNVTSILGSLTLHADPKSPIYRSWQLAYDTSKAAVNLFTIELAQELADTRIKVFAAHPGWVKTAMGGPKAPLELADGAKTSVMLALAGEEAASGSYVHLGKTLPW
jgi:NAD(P)-dependent dehydrogenase (short-subunit alcohol dehydrogenase family)